MSNPTSSAVAALMIVCVIPAIAAAQDAKGNLPVLSLAPQASSPAPQLSGNNSEIGNNKQASPQRPQISYPQPLAASGGASQSLTKTSKNVPGGAGVAKPVAKPAPQSLLGGGQDDEAKGQKLAAGDVLDPPAVILPEATTAVKLSSSDMNRIICTSGEVKEALTSDEKGLMIKITGKDVFVKYKVGKRNDGSLAYSTTPTELYIVCGGDTYSMIAFPSRLPSQTIKLSSGRENRIKENQALFAGLPFEKRVMRVIKEVYTDSMPDSYSVTPRNEVDRSWKGLVIALKREVDVEGEGMHLKEYHITLKTGWIDTFKLSEKMFLRKEFAINPIAVSIDKHQLRPGDVSRLFIVEQRADQSSDVSGLQMMTVDGSGLAGDASAPVGDSKAAHTQQKPLLPGNANQMRNRTQQNPMAGVAK